MFGLRNYEVDGKIPRCRPEKTLKDLVENYLGARRLKWGDIMDRGKARVGFTAANGLLLHRRGMWPHNVCVFHKYHRYLICA